MFAPPENITTEIFARVPDRFRAKRPRPWTDANKRGTSVDCFIEGPSFDREGNLYMVDIPYGRVFRMSRTGEFSLVTEYDGEPNGLKIHRDGRIFLANYYNGYHAARSRFRRRCPVVDRRWSEHFRGVNDLFFATNGDLYFTHQGQTGLHDPVGRVYCWMRGASWTC